MPTPHIQAERGDFADTVLLPGDPLRAQYIAETFLTDVRRVNAVRNMYGYTGRYRGRAISVMGSGMGIPSISIYAKELITDYDVKRLVRVGSCGAVRDDAQLRDIVIGMGACTDSKVNRIRFMDHDLAAIADFTLVRRTVEAAEHKGLPVAVGNLFSTDLFYSPQEELADMMKRYGIVGVEMEAAGFYGVAAEFGARALTVCTVSDHILRGESLSSEERQSSFDDMMEIALEGVLRDDNPAGV
ncbi:purine-nucleoside phosphorylase [Aidingimonas halophila]|uniref:Purine nucleoside phosphorylase DeoD-type n=1 Tax=Aidingimonas halophila TaxID=574349 RepID=A0A1H3E7S4_9GAMM|nr:purine-nucleoside phosphorylase [Aidingimonas halophila]GHC33955.1 purine nucleoside phosphorylase DeoD-type [Aidingimonas halophila]SDX74705.1 purine-nucleoside phosphorylase [Aidingimonas halophila]